MDPPAIRTVTSDKKKSDRRAIEPLKTIASADSGSSMVQWLNDSVAQFHRGPCDRAGKGQFDHHFGAGRGAAAHVDPPAMILHNLPVDCKAGAEAGGPRGKVGGKDLAPCFPGNAAP